METEEVKNNVTEGIIGLTEVIITGEVLAILFGWTLKNGSNL